MTLERYLSAAIRALSDIDVRIKNRSSIPTVYFTDLPNVGDLLNEYMIPRISGKPIIKVRSSIFPHLRAIGSVIGSSGGSSYVWGSGSIDGKTPNHPLTMRRIFALRGKKTYEILNRTFNGGFQDVPLGDPAVLMPRYFQTDVSKKRNVGFVPHFSDEGDIQEALNQINARDVQIISVKQKPEDFITQICQCRLIFSTSLHGLILADSYNIRNKWVSFSDRLLGGPFKFEDYYSTTDSPHEVPARPRTPWELKQMLLRADSICSVKAYTECKNELLESFPFCFSEKF